MTGSHPMERSRVLFMRLQLGILTVLVLGLDKVMHPLLHRQASLQTQLSNEEENHDLFR